MTARFFARPPVLAPFPIAAIAAMVAIACDKAPGDNKPTSGLVASASAGVVAQAPAGSASAASVKAAPPGPLPVWHLVGSFTAKVGEVNSPKAAREKTWTDDKGSTSIGPGKLDLTVHRPEGLVSGSVTGALGDLTVTGVLEGKDLRANLSPQNPNADGAMTGWMALTLEGSETAPKGLAGTLRVAGKDARLVREADVELKVE
jgi:hypothetical protein